jgi:hypothetical protein
MDLDKVVRKAMEMDMKRARGIAVAAVRAYGKACMGLTIKKHDEQQTTPARQATEQGGAQG